MNKYIAIILLCISWLLSAHAQEWISAPPIVYNRNNGADLISGFSALSQAAVNQVEFNTIGRQYPGTWQYHTLACNNTSSSQTCYAQIPAALYTALGGAAAFPGCSSTWTCTASSPGSSGTYTSGQNNERLLFQPGLHKQVVVVLGDSITQNEGGLVPAVGGDGPYPGVLMPFNVATVALRPVATSQYIRGQVIMTRAWSPPWSRLVINMGNGGWTFSVVGGGSYGGRGAYLQNEAMFNSLGFANAQQPVFVIELGTNDYDAYGGCCLYGSVTQGTPNLAGYVQTLASDIRTMYPSANGGAGPYIVVLTPLARVQQGNASYRNNTGFVDMGAYIAANMATVGVNILINYHYVGVFDPAAPTVTNNPNCYVDANTSGGSTGSGTHPTIYCGQVYMWNLVKEALDALQFGNAKGLPANMFTVNGIP